MSQHVTATTSRLDHASGTSCQPSVSLIPGLDGDLQIAIGRGSPVVLIDVQAARPDVEGQIHHDHATIRLTYDAVCELRELLDRIAEPPEPRQPALWSDATFSQQVHIRPRKRRAVA